MALYPRKYIMLKNNKKKINEKYQQQQQNEKNWMAYYCIE